MRSSLLCFCLWPARVGVGHLPSFSSYREKSRPEGSLWIDYAKPAYTLVRCPAGGGGVPHFRSKMLYSRPLRRTPARGPPEGDDSADNVLVAYQHREHAEAARDELPRDCGVQVQVEERPLDELRYVSWLLRTPVVVLMTARCELNDRREEYDLMYIGPASWDNVDPLVLPRRSPRR